jgi:hypothetical protein
LYTSFHKKYASLAYENNPWSFRSLPLILFLNKGCQLITFLTCNVQLAIRDDLPDPGTPWTSSIGQTLSVLSLVCPGRKPLFAYSRILLTSSFLPRSKDPLVLIKLSWATSSEINVRN